MLRMSLTDSTRGDGSARGKQLRQRGTDRAGMQRKTPSDEEAIGTMTMAFNRAMYHMCD